VLTLCNQLADLFCAEPDFEFEAALDFKPARALLLLSDLAALAELLAVRKVSTSALLTLSLCQLIIILFLLVNNGYIYCYYPFL
jgi:hypothetical protein